MLPLRVLVRPMNHTAPIVPFVLPQEFHQISRLQLRQTWRQINIVGNQQRLP